MSLTASRRNAHRDLPGHTDEDRERIRRDAARELLSYELDGDRTDPTWLRYCERHGLDPETAGAA